MFINIARRWVVNCVSAQLGHDVFTQNHYFLGAVSDPTRIWCESCIWNTLHKVVCYWFWNWGSEMIGGIKFTLCKNNKWFYRGKILGQAGSFRPGTKTNLQYCSKFGKVLIRSPKLFRWNFSCSAWEVQGFVDKKLPMKIKAIGGYSENPSNKVCNFLITCGRK